jgi:ADP-heptose:LPS heptosyltransferase
LSCDLVYAVNTCGQDIEEYLCKKRVCIPADGRPRLVPVEFARTMLKRGLVKIVDDFDKWMQDNPDHRAHFLIVRDGGIGDLILLEPCLRSLKTAHPKMHLGVACDKANMPVVQGFAEVDEVLPIGGYAPEDWDSIIDLRAYSETCATRATKHRTDVYAERVWGAEVDKGPRASWPICFVPSKSKRVKVALQCGSSHKYRDYLDTPRLAEMLAEKYEVILLDYKIEFPAPKGCIDLRCKLDVAQFLSAVQCADVFVGPDSGGMHVALAAGVPTVALFGIIKPELRTTYYNTERTRILFREVCQYPGCGAWHMERCAVDPVRAACMAAIKAEEIAAAVDALAPSAGKQPQAVTAQPVKQDRKPELTIAAICLNEAKAIPRWLALVAKHPAVARVVVIDGGSTDGSSELLKAAGCEVYVHPYLPHYHDQQAMQRNICMSYCREGEPVLVMDFDECFSKALRERLFELIDSGAEYIELPRKTHARYDEAISGQRQIGQYPDWQPRFYRWSHRFKFAGGAHHRTLNVPPPVQLHGMDILHFQDEYGKRDKLESQWAQMMTDTRRYYGA